LRFSNEEGLGYGVLITSGDTVKRGAEAENAALFVNGVVCRAKEAHFGGVVVQPLCAWLSEGWFGVTIAEGADKARPGLYEWHIDGVGSYIGKYQRIRRPLKEYERNLARLLSGLPYRKSKPDGFRRIHRELAEAVQSLAHDGSRPHRIRSSVMSCVSGCERAIR
jgi:hypothetical protein